MTLNIISAIAKGTSEQGRPVCVLDDA